MSRDLRSTQKVKGEDNGIKQLVNNQQERHKSIRAAWLYELHVRPKDALYVILLGQDNAVSVIMLMHCK